MDDTAAALTSFVNPGSGPIPLGLVGPPDMAAVFTPGPPSSSLLVEAGSDDDIGDVVGATPPAVDDDVSDIAFAAEAAAEAVAANDAAVSQQQQLDAVLQFQQQQQQQLPGSATATSAVTNPATVASMPNAMAAAPLAVPAVTAAAISNNTTNNATLTCRICKQGETEGRPIIRFAPVDNALHAAAAAPGVATFSQDVQLHVFCGKTASILPNVNSPELEILTKAGLKNKHGIGPEVNAALARTRCAILHQDGAKEKNYYLVREFEAHLAAIRHTHINFLSNGGSTGGTNGNKQQQLQGNIPQIIRPPKQAAGSLPAAPQPNGIFNSRQQAQNQRQLAQRLQPQQTGVPLQPGPAPTAMTPQVQQNQHYIPNNPYDITQYQAAFTSVNQGPGPNRFLPSIFQQQGAQNSMSNINNDGSNSAPNKRLPARATAGKKKSKSSKNGGKGANKRRQRQPPHPQQQFQQQGLLIPVPLSAPPQQLLLSQTVERRQGPPASSPTPQQVEMTPEGKVKCPCGGKHWPAGSPRHAASWRSHLQTKRHKKWMAQNGFRDV